MKTNTAAKQDWTTDANHPTYEENGTWELWMSFGGVTGSQAFDDGYDQKTVEYAHPALSEAHEAGRRQRNEDDNE